MIWVLIQTHLNACVCAHVKVDMVAVVKEVLLRQDDQPVHCQKGEEEDGDQRQNSGRAPRENCHESQRQINLALVSAFTTNHL